MDSVAVCASDMEMVANSIEAARKTRLSPSRTSWRRRLLPRTEKIPGWGMRIIARDYSYASGMKPSGQSSAGGDLRPGVRLRFPIPQMGVGFLELRDLSASK